TYRRLQHGGADYEVLMNRSTVNTFLNMDLHPVSGTGFRLSDLGDVQVTGLEISLDLNARGPEDGRGGLLGRINVGADQSRNPSIMSNPVNTRALPANGNNGGGSVGNSSAYQQHHGSNAFRWTFAPDNDVDFRESADGLTCRCLETAESGQI